MPGPTAHNPAASPRQPAALPLRDRILQILDLIRPAVQSDGGDVEFLGVSPDGVVRIRLHGACVGCPSATMTLRMGIERNLKDNIPEVTGVEAVE